MQNADLFEYLAAFVTIVLAVALTDMIQSVHRILRARDRVKWDVLTPLLALNVFLALLSEFFGLWTDARFEQLTFYGLIGFMVTPTLVALVAFAILPDDVPKRGLDLRKFYFDNRRYVAVLFLLTASTEYMRFVRRMALDDAFHNRELWLWFITMASFNVLLLVMIYFSKKWWIQLASLVGLLVLAHLSYGRWSIQPQPVA